MTDQPKIILITGSTDGVGRRVAEKLAVAGNKILIHGRSHQRGEDLVRFIRSKGGRRCLLLSTEGQTGLYYDRLLHARSHRQAYDIAARAAFRAISFALTNLRNLLQEQD